MTENGHTNCELRPATHERSHGPRAPSRKTGDVSNMNGRCRYRWTMIASETLRDAPYQER